MSLADETKEDLGNKDVLEDEKDLEAIAVKIRFEVGVTTLEVIHVKYLDKELTWRKKDPLDPDLAKLRYSRNPDLGPHIL